MRLPTLALFVSLLPLTALAQEESPAPKPQRPADHVVLISIDGLRPEFYLDPAWPAPTIQQMAREGAHAQAVQTVFPSVTYPSHTTIVTGALPARHGVVYNRPFEPEGQTGRWFWEESTIQVPTLWDAVQEAGLESAAISWPVSVGAPITRNLPEVWSLERDAKEHQAIKDATTPPELFEELEREATGKLAGRYSMSYLGRDQLVGLMGAYLLETHKPALLALHLVESDHFMHELGRDGEHVRRAVAAADAAVSLVVEAAERAGILERTAFVITGDHGFVDTHAKISPNVWLTQAGLMEAKPDRGDWKATFHTTGGAACLILRDPEDAETLTKVREVLESLPGRVRANFRVLDEATLASRGTDPRVKLALSALPGYSFSAGATGSGMRVSGGGTHGYFPDFPQIHTGFVGWGAGFRAGAVAPQLDLADVAPAIAKLLKLPFEAPDGQVPSGLLKLR
jgi:predicted AlkP superfamily pyrophosphatase or phosphodiesterase